MNSTWDRRSGAAIRLADVVKRYPARDLPALDDITIDVFEGEFVALMGASGSGKTTLLNLIGALDSPTAGEIEIFGKTITGASDTELTTFRRNTVGFVFQTFHLIPALTALENVITPMVASRKLKRRIPQGVKGLQAVGLDGKERSLPGELSGGEQQRVAIARALVMGPKLLLADEPTGNLDARTGKEIIDLIHSIRDERSMTVLIATHDPAIAVRADRVIALSDGRRTADIDVRAGETPESLLAKLATPVAER